MFYCVYHVFSSKSKFIKTKKIKKKKNLKKKQAKKIKSLNFAESNAHRKQTCAAALRHTIYFLALFEAEISSKQKSSKFETDPVLSVFSDQHLQNDPYILYPG